MFLIEFFEEVNYNLTKKSADHNKRMINYLTCKEFREVKISLAKKNGKNDHARVFLALIYLTKYIHNSKF